MKHLIKKISLIGAGGGGGGGSSEPSPPPPSRLEPPRIGKYNPYVSYNQIEVIDLLSEGPILGLSNSFGRHLDSTEIFQGIYLDDTPIATSSPTSTAGSELFVENSLGVAAGDIGRALENGVNASKGSAYFASYHNLNWQENKSSSNLTASSMNSIGLFTAIAMWGDAAGWTTDVVMWDMPNLVERGFAKVSPNVVPYYSPRTTTHPPPFYYKKSQREEVHFGLTEKQAGIAFDTFNALNTIKDSSSINQYERQIINKKINLIQTKIFDQTYSYYSDQQTNVRNVAIGGDYIWVFLPVSPTNEGALAKKNWGLSSTNKSAIVGSSLISFNFYFKDSTIDIGRVVDCIIPEIDSLNNFTGKVYGFIACRIPCERKEFNLWWTRKTRYFSRGDGYMREYKQSFSALALDMLKSMSIVAFSTNAAANDLDVFNYNNILSEIKYGSYDQSPLNYFNKVFVDKEYKAKLLGPFRNSNQIRRISETANLLNRDPANLPVLVGGSPSLTLVAGAEGSLDSDRLSAKGSYADTNRTFNENAVPFTHIVENPQTSSVIVTITVNELSDTLTKQLDLDGVSTDTTNGSMENPGTKIPSTVSIRIETGKDINGVKTVVTKYDYNIVGSILSPASIDFGNLLNNPTDYKIIGGTNSINTAITLPSITEAENFTRVKRYVKVYKVSTETHSVLIRKELFLQKITEVINTQLSYPFCALIGNRIDARNLSNLPTRTYDCRLKLIKIPSNYNIFNNSYDVRYQSSKSTYDSNKKRIYDGDWDGSFKMGWTDNPAWILYDILINNRYGLGQYIDESQINVWELYKIGRYCDAVDDNGYYNGVSDGKEGLEPRFSCNIMFSSATKIFDTINIIANLFRGSVFFSNSEINFSDDRPKEPIAFFNNTNVLDGLFNYITNKKDDVFNAVEVAYLDRFDNFKTKIEFVEDAEDIRKRGPQKTVINTLGVTSRAMARRIGQHVIWQTIKENQAVEFTAGLESLICQPGDLIVIDDELKTRNINCGRILDIDIRNRALTLSNNYTESLFNGYIHLYTPTGYSTKEELYELANKGRQRLPSFTISSAISTISSITGNYVFSKYDKNDMPLYVGYQPTLKQNTFCYYDNDELSWVFSTGFAYKRNNLYDKFISDVDTSRSIQESINFLYTYNKYPQRASQAINITPALTLSQDYNIGGIYDNEIITQSSRQITKYQISGVTTNINDGSIVYLHENNFNLNLLSIIEQGSPYRVELKSYTDQIYKVISVREEAQNQYLVVATKYDSGKWSAIENDNTLENTQSIYYNKDAINSRLTSLATPTNLYLNTYNETANNFSLTGSFVGSESRYKITVENKAVGFKYELITGGVTRFNIPNLNDLGKYDLTVQALAVSAANLDSYPAKIYKFIGYQKTDMSTFDRPYIENFTIL